MWVLFAFLSAIFAALTSILAKIGVSGVESNLGTALRTVVVLVMAWCMVLLTGKSGQVSQVRGKELLFICLSGLATGGSWLCYYKALQDGLTSVVVPIDKLSVVITMILAALILHESFTIRSVLGCVLIASGTLLMVL